MPPKAGPHTLSPCGDGKDGYQDYKTFGGAETAAVVVASCDENQRGDVMKGVRVFAIILVILGILGAVYGGFSYTHKSKEAQLGPLSLSVKKKHHVNIPLWVGAGAIIVGGVLLVIAGNGNTTTNTLG